MFETVHTAIDPQTYGAAMPEQEPKREWQRVLDEYMTACAAFDLANRLVRNGDASDEEWVAADLAKRLARARIIETRREVDHFDPDQPEALPIG
jgi:hypothetical protein